MICLHLHHVTSKMETLVHDITKLNKDEVEKKVNKWIWLKARSTKRPNPTMKVVVNEQGDPLRFGKNVSTTHANEYCYDVKDHYPILQQIFVAY